MPASPLTTRLTGDSSWISSSPSPRNALTSVAPVPHLAVLPKNTVHPSPGISTIPASSVTVISLFSSRKTATSFVVPAAAVMVTVVPLRDTLVGPAAAGDSGSVASTPATVVTARDSPRAARRTSCQLGVTSWVFPFLCVLLVRRGLRRIAHRGGES